MNDDAETVNDLTVQPELVWVFVTTAVRTSTGSEPGPKQLPAAEAAALVARKHAIYGQEPPRGWY